MESRLQGGPVKFNFISHVNQPDFIDTGMSGGLSVGSNAAKTLAAALNKPLVGVHHMVSAMGYFLREFL